MMELPEYTLKSQEVIPDIVKTVTGCKKWLKLFPEEGYKQPYFIVLFLIYSIEQLYTSLLFT